MATWEMLKAVRLKLRDPAGVIALDHVADFASLPAVPRNQTAYKLDDTSEYYIYSGTWARTNLLMSDEMLNSMIDAVGENNAVLRSITMIISSLASEMKLVRMSSGTEDMQFQSLSDLLSFYRSLRAMYKEEDIEGAGVSTGRFIRMATPAIGGVYEITQDIYYNGGC